MKLTTIEIITAHKALTSFSDNKMTLPLAVKVTRVTKELANVVEAFEKNRKDIFDEYGTEGEKPGTIDISTENFEAFNAAYTELMESEIEVEVDPIAMASLPDTLEVTPHDLAALGCILTED